jgi:hypothetical protein
MGRPGDGGGRTDAERDAQSGAAALAVRDHS